MSSSYASASPTQRTFYIFFPFSPYFAQQIALIDSMLLSQPPPDLCRSFKRPHLLMLLGLVPFAQVLSQYLAH